METSYHTIIGGKGLTLVRAGSLSPPPLHTEAPSSPVGLPPGLQFLPAVLLERGVVIFPGELRCGRREQVRRAEKAP